MAPLMPLGALAIAMLLWGAPPALEGRLVAPGAPLAAKQKPALPVETYTVGTDFCLVNYAGLNITKIVVSDVDSSDWDDNYSPAQDLDKLTLAADRSACYHMEIAKYTSTNKFTMTVTFTGELQATVKVDQDCATGTTHGKITDVTSTIPDFTAFKHCGLKYQVVYLRSAQPDNSKWMAAVQAANPKARLSDVVLVEAHDAGMFKTGSKCLIPGMVRTQDLDTENLLKAGVRVFDFRPTSTSGGKAYWGHYDGSFGCDGGDVETSLKQIATFLGENTGETVIVELSHGGGDEVEKLAIEAVKTHLAGQLLKTTSDARLDNMTLAELAGKAIVVVSGFDPYKDPTAGIHTWRGYTDGDSGLHIYDSYANSGSTTTMVTDQINKVKENCVGLGQDKLFKFCYTLTAQSSDWSTLHVGDLAASSNGYFPDKLIQPAAEGTLIGATGKAVKPNIISMDFLDAWSVRAANGLNKVASGVQGGH